MATILISEADSDVRRLLTLLVRRLGHEAVVLDEHVVCPPRAGLLLLEPSSPSALEHARLLRALRPDLPVISMSCLDEPSQFLLEGPLQYLPKPFTIEQMREQVARTLR